jgi:WD40 repeat protein
MFRNEMCVSNKIMLTLVFFLIATGLSPLVRAQDNKTIDTQRAFLKVLSPSVKRILYEPSAFSGPGIPIPYSDRGYLIARRIESFASDTPNVMLYGKDGKKVREAAIWFPESIRVAITSAAVTPDGRIVASGEADKADGTRAGFIALTDLTGKITRVIQTTDFYPTNVCVAPDNTVWSFGATWWDNVNHRPLPGDLLRHFDFGKGQLAGYIPRSTFPDHSSYDNSTQIRCSAEEVAILSRPENTYILVSYENEVPRIYDASSPVGISLVGFGILGQSKAYAVLINRERSDDPTQGLYSLELDETAKAVRWSPVQGAVGPRTGPATVIRLWGTDREYLVLSRSQDPAGTTALHWASISEK